MKNLTQDIEHRDLGRAHVNGSTAQRRPIVTAIGRLVVAVLAFNALSPLSALAQDKGTVSPLAQNQLRQIAALQQRVEQARLERSRGPAERIDDELRQAQDLLETLKADAQARGTIAAPAAASGASRRALSEARRGEHKRELRARLDAAKAGQAEVQAEFDRVGQDIAARKLPAEIRARHEQAVRDFASRKAEFERLNDAWKADSSDARLGDLADFFERHPSKRKAPARDPKKMPWATPAPTERAPAVTQTAWFQNLWGDRKTRLAQAGGSVGGIDFDIPPEPGQTPVLADLAETPETQRSAAIVAKAAELGHNPLAIHNWVRNTIDFVPTWGAVQSAQDTLDKKRGNAHDIASLEIALLRAAKIPARYRYGTIELPAEQVQNWVGGVDNPSAAQQLLGQGGIANTALVGNGRVTAIRLEHVWVEAFVNWAPSRGARQGKPTQHVNPVGPHNAWVSLDPSFKQYTHAPGMDLKSAASLDPQALIDAARTGATVNEAEGWVQNLNQLAVQGQFLDLQARLSAHIEAQNPTASVSEVVGRRIVQQTAPTLLAGTPAFKVIASGQQTAAVPVALQHRFTYKLFASEYDRMLDSPFLQFTERVSQLLGKRFTLTYLPATQADADLLASYLPKPHADGSPIQPTEFPRSLPGYLIRLTPQLRLDGEVVAVAPQSFVMGTELLAEGGYTSLGQPGAWDLTHDDSNTVGSATVIGLSAHGVGNGQLTRLRDRLQTTRDRLVANDVATLVGEQVSGDLLTMMLWSWFAAADSHGRMLQRQSNTVENGGLSYGLMHAFAQPTYSWGVIRNVSFPGVNLDIGHVRNLAWSRSNKSTEWVLHNRLRGQYMSALEHAIPERFINDPATCNPPDSASPVANLPACPKGISAVRAIELAATQGQRIFTITSQAYQTNPTLYDTRLVNHSASTRQAVASYLGAGMDVTIHESPVVQDGWRGSGYIFIDPSTGAGGYIIEGGSSGGALLGLVLGLLAGVAAIVAGPIVAGLVGAVVFGFGQFFNFFTSNTDNLNFSAARLIGTMAGIVLAVILGQYVLISFSPLFVIGMVLLLITLVRLLVMELYTALVGIHEESISRPRWA